MLPPMPTLSPLAEELVAIRIPSTLLVISMAFSYEVHISPALGLPETSLRPHSMHLKTAVLAAAVMVSLFCTFGAGLGLLQHEKALCPSSWHL